MFNVFCRMRTQWQVDGWGGWHGLRYESLPVVLRAEQVPRSAHPQLLDDLQVMEFETMRLRAQALDESRRKAK